MPAGLIAGAGLGILSGLGIGGGSLMLLYLTAVAGFSPETARTVNLLYYLPVALVSTAMRRKTRLPPGRLIRTAALCGIAGAILGTVLRRTVIEEALLRKAAGFLFLLTGARELCYRDRELR